MTPSTTAGGALSQNNNINNNNNNYYLKSTTTSGVNPLKQFMSPQHYDDVGMSTIEKISRRLEMFYSNATDSPSANAAPSLDNPALDLDCTIVDSAACSELNETLDTKTDDSNTHAINNNPAINTNETFDVDPALCASPKKPSSDVKTTMLLNNNPFPNNNDDEQEVFRLRAAERRTRHQPPAQRSTNPATDKKHHETTDSDEPVQEITKDFNNLVNGDTTTDNQGNNTPANNNCSLRKNTPADLPMIIKQAIDHKDTNNVTSRKANKRQKAAAAMTLNIGLAQDAPPETPAIESAPQSIDFEATLNAVSAANVNTNTSSSSDEELSSSSSNSSSSDSTDSDPEIADLNLSIENKLNISNDDNHEKNADDRETDSDFNRAINAMQYEDALDEKLAAILDVDADFVDPQFTGANYWYIRPELPLDIIDFLPETLSLERQFNSITVNDIYNESMNRDNKEAACRSAEETVVDDSWQLQLAKLHRDGGLQPDSVYNRPFEQDVLPGFLVRYYVSMVRFNDSVMNMHCVYNFPAVVLTLGPPHWHMMHSLLLALCDDLQWKIRKTVAVFIYQIGLIIGRELAGQDLVPVFTGFFKDLDEVKIEALRNLTRFLQVVDIEHHHKIIFRLGCCLNTDNYANWRFREELAQQVLNLIQTYGGTYNVDGMTYLTGIAINLLSDEVCSVREIALTAVSWMEKSFCWHWFCNVVFVPIQVVATFKVSSSGHITDLISLLTEEFAINNFWRMRQMYIHICHKLVSLLSIALRINGINISI